MAWVLVGFAGIALFMEHPVVAVISLALAVVAFSERR